jgi:hypothetical protein
MRVSKFKQETVPGATVNSRPDRSIGRFTRRSSSPDRPRSRRARVTSFGGFAFRFGRTGDRSVNVGAGRSYELGRLDGGGCRRQITASYWVITSAPISFSKIGPRKTKGNPRKTHQNPRKNPWIYLDLFVRIGTFQWVTADPNKKICLYHLFRADRSFAAIFGGGFGRGDQIIARISVFRKQFPRCP